MSTRSHDLGLRLLPLVLAVLAGSLVVGALATRPTEAPTPSPGPPGPAAAIPSPASPTATTAPAIPQPATPQPSPPRGVGRIPPFTAVSPWNTPIPADAKPDPNSARLIETIDGPLSSNGSAYTYPVYYADSTTPRTRVPAERGWTVVRAPDRVYTTNVLWVPIPELARPSAGTDAQMIVIDVETGAEYDLWGVRRAGDGSWRVRNASRYNVHWDGVPPRYGSRGAGIPYLAGLVRPEEIAAGRIEHALAFGYDRPAADRFVHPATKTDGEDDHPYAIPQGARLQLDPSADEHDFAEWGLDRTGRIIARALQRYGMYLVDYSDANKIYVEDLSANAYRQQEGVSWSDPETFLSADTLAGIPIEMFRVLELPADYWP